MAFHPKKFGINDRNITCLYMCGEWMTCRFSGNVWPDPGVYPNLVEPRSTERQKVISVSSFDIQEASHMGHDRRNRFRVSRADKK